MKVLILVVIILLIAAASFYTGLLVTRYLLTKSFTKLIDDRIRWIKSSIRNYEEDSKLPDIRDGLPMEMKNLVRLEGLHCGLDILNGLRNKVELNGIDAK